ncbi:MAG: alanine racemase [Acidobacteria bacterium]|nr:alanine racemase [Acidobacteriota bacterium]
MSAFLVASGFSRKIPVPIRSTRADVNLNALQENYQSITRFLASERSPSGIVPGIIAVVKANAYGHGAERVGLALQQAGATVLSCADIEEGVALRKAGVTTQVLVFGALSVSDLAGLFDYNLTPTISTPFAGRAVAAEAQARGTAIRYHLKIDTGMNRLGFRHDNLQRTLPDLVESPQLRLEAVYTHFATADDLDHPLFDKQRRRFDRVLSELKALGVTPAIVHAANSAALLRDSRVWYDMVRPGLLLYGVVPSPLATTIALEPVMTIKSRIVAVKGIRPDEAVGYGAQFMADEPKTIAVVPAGYADGLDLRMAGRASVLVGGRRVPIVGSVCMDMIMLDVTGLPVNPGDEVVIIGTQGSQSITARETASAIGTIPYELLCRVGSRIERVYP